jgi:hypothetical protein
MRITVFAAACTAALSTAFLTLAAPALASNEIRSITADAYGNGVIITSGGSKIIAVGQSQLADGFTPPAIVTENCREVGIVLKGRSFMYGVSDGDPVPQATKIVCE